MEAPLHPVSCHILGLNILQEAANSRDAYDLHHSSIVIVSSCQSTDATLCFACFVSSNLPKCPIS